MNFNLQNRVSVEVQPLKRSVWVELTVCVHVGWGVLRISRCSGDVKQHFPAELGKTTSVLIRVKRGIVSIAISICFISQRDPAVFKWKFT